MHWYQTTTEDKTERQNTGYQETILARNPNLARNTQVPKIYRATHSEGTILRISEGDSTERTWGTSYTGRGSAGTTQGC